MNSQFLKNYGSIYQLNFFRGDFPYLCALNEFPLKAGISYVLFSLPVLPDWTRAQRKFLCPKSFWLCSFKLWLLLQEFI